MNYIYDIYLNILFFLLILFINLKIAKIKTSFLDVLDNFLNNNLFY